MSPRSSDRRPARWRASRRAFLRALSGLLGGAGTALVVSSPLGNGEGRSSSLTPRPALADGYQTAPPHEAAHAFNAVGALWPGGLPSLRSALEVRTSADGQTWTPWHPLPLDGDLGRQPHTSLLFVPASRLVQHRLPAPAPLPRLVLIDTLDGPSASDLRRIERPPRLLAAGEAAQSRALAVARPAIVSRAEWGANETWRWWAPEYRVTHHLAIHHSGATTGGADPAAAVRSIYHYHSVVLNWGDIGYHYLVDWLGTIYEGRYGGPNVVGGHIRGRNPGVEGIAALGNYDFTWPTDALEQALASLVAWRAEALGLDPQGASPLDDNPVPNLLGHRDAAQTNCPGFRLYVDLAALRLDAQRRIGFIPRLAVEIASVQAEHAVVEVGDRLAVTLSLRNRGTIPLLALADGTAGYGERRLPGFVEGEARLLRPRVPAATVLAALGTGEEVAAGRRLREAGAGGRRGTDLAGEDAPDLPGDAPAAPDPAAGYAYRWALPRTVPPGESGTATGYLRLREPGPRLLGAAILREAGDLLAAQPPGLAVQVIRAPAALRVAGPTTTTRLAFPWLDEAHPSADRRLAASNPAQVGQELRWTIFGVDERPWSYGATLGSHSTTRWDERSQAAAPPLTAWPAAPSLSTPTGPNGGQLSRDLPAAVLESPAGLAAALRLQAPAAAAGSGNGGAAVAYTALSPSSEPLRAPLLGDGWKTEITVQNLSERPTTVQVTWHGAAAGRGMRRQLGPGGAAGFLAPPDATMATVAGESGAALAGLAIATPEGGSPLTYPLSPAARSLLLPLLGELDGWTATLLVASAADAAAEVGLEWTPHAGGAPWADRVPLAPGSSVSFPRDRGPGFPTAASGAGRVEASGDVSALVVYRHAAGPVYLAYAGLPAVAGDLLLPLADLPGLPEQRAVAVQNGGEGSARITLHFYDPAGADLGTLVDALPARGARAYRPRPVAADAASILIRGDGAPLAAALLQSASP